MLAEIIGPDILIVGWIVPLVFGVWTAVDASRRPDWAFERAGTSKTLWVVLPLVGVLLCGVVAIVSALVWFFKTRGRVDAARAAA
jgi:hypothetical protein